MTNINQNNDCSQCKSYANSIISACQSVGKDYKGDFPFNAFDLAQRIIKLEQLIYDEGCKWAELNIDKTKIQYWTKFANYGKNRRF